MDIYSRKTVGWEVPIAESAWLGADVIEKAALRERLHGIPFALHSDNGSPRRAISLLAYRTELGITPSNSRTRVSDDNAYIEALFKTLKVTPQYPTDGFTCIDVCREWTQQFVQFYNGQHRHKVISWVTPTARHDKLDEDIQERRSRVFAAARQENPNRWSKKERRWNYMKSVTLNGQKELM